MADTSDAFIRPATVADADEIARVHVVSWRSTYRGLIPDAYLDSLSVDDRAARWTEQLSDPGPSHCRFVAEVGGAIVGFATGGPEREHDPFYTGELYAIYLLDEYQGLGIGCLLFTHVAHALVDAGMASLLVWVLSANPACRFYERLGGRVVRSKIEEIGGVALEETAYGWERIEVLLELL